MRNLRILSPHFSRIRKTFAQNPSSDSPSTRHINFPGLETFASPSSVNHRNYTTASPESRPAPSERVSAIVDEISGLTLLEVADLTEVLREKLDVKEMPVMTMMMPGMGFGGFRGAGKGGPGAKGVEEKKEEKTAFDVKLDAFDAASKIKIIKEVRTFTNLGLKEAKDLVEKAPTLLKKGVTKEEAETIIAKMKEVGAKVSME
ncbi:uncharacterized protein LOC101204400 [Cucumis sativus]|uniref:50S ribosomal protein L7/L12 n=1 Tax=Cucumis sativus TaxID=3659 RepID=A0A0A0KMA8_CUCSA|nr:uncharacterized protein LOC101204400 [Cucumis sativus]KGN48876.1 hypothetical protein Csa_002925 [Cucumis sativus]